MIYYLKSINIIAKYATIIIRYSYLIPSWHAQLCGSLMFGLQWFSQVALASVGIFHEATATEEHVRHG